MTKKLVVILLVLVLAGALGVAAFAVQGQTVPVNMTLTGTIITIGDGVGLFDVNVKGQPGTANARGISFSHLVPHADLPDGNQCIDTPGPIDGVVIDPGGQFNMIFSDGSMLFGNAASGGYVCFAPSLAYAPYDLAGGTGRFEGATGHVNFEITTHPFGAPGAPVTPETGTATGEIILP